MPRKRKVAATNDACQEPEIEVLPVEDEESAAREDDKNEEAEDLWKRGKPYGPMFQGEDEVRDWVFPAPKSDVQVDLQPVILEEGVKFVTKRLLASNMQQQNRSPIDLYATLGPELREFLKINFKVGTSQKGKNRPMKRDGVNRIFKLAQKRLHDFFGFRIIKFTKDDDSNEKKKTHKNAKAIVVSGLDFQESDPPFYKQTLLRMIATGSLNAIQNGRTAFKAIVLALVGVDLELQTKDLWMKLTQQKWCNAQREHPEIGKLEPLLAMMENESYIRKIIKHDHNGNEEEYLVLGPRAKLEVGLDGLVDLIEQIYLTHNDMHDAHRKTWRATIKQRMQNESLNAVSSTDP